MVIRIQLYVSNPKHFDLITAVIKHSHIAGAAKTSRINTLIAAAEDIGRLGSSTALPSAHRLFLVSRNRKFHGKLTRSTNLFIRSSIRLRVNATSRQDETALGAKASPSKVETNNSFSK